jgi:hypothetical protein
MIMLPPTATQPNAAVSLIYVGAVILAASVLTLSIGLTRNPAWIAEVISSGKLGLPVTY